MSNLVEDKIFSDQFEGVDLGLHGVRLPEFLIDKSNKRELNISEDCSNYDFLRALALNGFKSLNINKNSKFWQ